MILPFDELNTLRRRLSEYFEEYETETGERKARIKSRDAVYDIIDMMLDLFLLAYANGVTAVNEQFGTNIEPTPEDIERTVYQKIDGATWEDRVWTWYDEDGTEDDIMRIAETESHRDGNTAAVETAVKAGAKSKTWVTMNDDRVRDTHFWLEGLTVGVDDDFYTYDGDHAPAPGLFQLAENNVNCRCELQFA